MISRDLLSADSPGSTAPANSIVITVDVKRIDSCSNARNANNHFKYEYNLFIDCRNRSGAERDCGHIISINVLAHCITCMRTGFGGTRRLWGMHFQISFPLTAVANAAVYGWVIAKMVGKCAMIGTSNINSEHKMNAYAAKEIQTAVHSAVHAKHGHN